MKWALPPPLVAFVGAVLWPLANGVQLRAISGDKTITQVVKLLQDMLDASKKDADKDREAYAKYKCYCDTNTDEKMKSIADLTKQISLLESEVAHLQGDNGLLSTQTAELKAQMDENEQAQKEANALREEEAKSYAAEQADLTSAVTQLGKAIEALAAIGADQSLASSAEHEQYMAGYKQASLVGLRTTVGQALLAANSILSSSQKKKMQAFLQTRSPFGGTYSAQSGEVVGILKQMKETFESNLASATAAEQAAIKAHAAFIQQKTDDFNTMKTAYDEKQGTMGANDGDLSTKKEQYGTAVQQKDDDTAFLASLEDMCTKKAAEYELRVQFRSNEEAAISKAIAILNSDYAYQAFGKVAATSTGATSFVQVSWARRRGALQSTARASARRVLQEAFRTVRSARLTGLANMLLMENPFNRVLDEIDKMKALIDAEAKADKENLDWCTNERTVSDASLKTKTDQITDLNTAITDLENAIDNPETGLKKAIVDTETSLTQNYKAQTDETATRRTENVRYKETVDSCAEAESILHKAIEVLEAYYKKLAEAPAGALLQEDPAPPETWDAGAYKGQSEKGNDVVTMLKFVLTQTETEETTAHDTEKAAQAAYEDSMTSLKKEESDFQDQLASTKKELADKEAELETKRIDLDKTEQEKTAIERYLERIKPGCDFITNNFDAREANRGTEKTALDKAVTLLKGTTAFAAAEAKEKEISQGPCAAKCKPDDQTVDCLACLAKVSVPGYCAGHPGTKGC